MAAPLPRIMIGRHEYEVDMYAGELRSVKDKSKALELFKMDVEGDRLAFWFNYSTMMDLIFPDVEGDRLAFWFNTETQALAGKPQDKDQPVIQRFSFPVHSLDPDFFKQIKAEAREAEKMIREGKSVYHHPGGIIHAPVQQDTGKPGLLPLVSLYGTDFYLDLRLQELRQVDNPHNTIACKHLHPDEFHFMLWYDTTAKNAFTGTLEQARQRHDVKALVLPPLDLMVRDGVRRHEEKIRPNNTKQDTLISSRRKRGRGLLNRYYP